MFSIAFLFLWGVVASKYFPGMVKPKVEETKVETARPSTDAKKPAAPVATAPAAAPGATSSPRSCRTGERSSFRSF
jgi:hypothetical protein